MRLKYLDFAQFHHSQDQGGQKIETLSQICKGNSNFLILPPFLFPWTCVVKNLKFEPKFQRDSKFLILPNSIVRRNRWSKYQIWAKFTMPLKYLEFAKFHCSQNRDGQKMSNLSQIFNGTQNFLIFPNFMVCMTGVIKNPKFEPSFQPDFKFLILPNFIIRRTEVIKNLTFLAIFSTRLDTLILPNFIINMTKLVKKLKIWAKFWTRLKFGKLKIFEWRCRFGSNLRLLITLVLRIMNFAQFHGS